MNDDFEILTPRLILRHRTVKDAEMIAIAMQPVWHHLQLWMFWARDGANTIEAIKESALNTTENTHRLIGLCRETGRFVMMTGMDPCENNIGQFETGYWVEENFLGKGYATEGCNAIIRWGFEALAVKSIYICHFEGNNPSERVIQKLGFTKTGVREKAQARCLDGKLLDVHEYIMTDPAVLPPLDVEWRHRCP